MDKSFIRLMIAAVAILSINACTSENHDVVKLACEANPAITDKSKCDKINAFDLSCLESGGEIDWDREGNYCKCGISDNKIICMEGVICQNKGDKCMIECTTGETRCVSGNFSTCDDGKWTEPINCLCEDNKSCKKCPKKLCENDEDGVGTITTCSDDGFFKSKSTCSNNNSCNSNRCGDCHDNTMKCLPSATASAEIQVCVNGEYTTYFDNKIINKVFEQYKTDHELGAETLLPWEIVLDGDKHVCAAANQLNYTPAKLGCSADKSACGTCNAEDTWCTYDDQDPNKTMLYTCKDADWDLTETRPNEDKPALSCNETYDNFGECHNGDFKLELSKSIYGGCEEPGVYLCSEGAFQKNSDDRMIRCSSGSGSTNFSIYSNYQDIIINIVLNKDIGCDQFTDPQGAFEAEFDIDSCQGHGQSLLTGCQGKCYNVYNSEGVLTDSFEKFINEYFGITCGDGDNSLACDGSRYKFFNCEKDGTCNNITFCVDSVVVDSDSVDTSTDKTNSSYYIHEKPIAWVINFDSSGLIGDDGTASGTIKATFTPAPNGCNSNKTDNAYDYSDPATCSKYAIGSSVKYNPDELSELDFNLCQPGSASSDAGNVRKVHCTDLFGSEFTCEVKYSSGSWNGSTACIDFYDPKTLKRRSYKLTVSSHGSFFTGTASVSDGTIKECANGCNADWSGCAE